MTKVGLVGADRTMERGWEEMKAERLAGALKVRLRSLDFTLGAVRAVEGFLKGDN